MGCLPLDRGACGETQLAAASARCSPFLQSEEGRHPCTGLAPAPGLHSGATVPQTLAH